MRGRPDGLTFIPRAWLRCFPASEARRRRPRDCAGAVGDGRAAVPAARHGPHTPAGGGRVSQSVRAVRTRDACALKKRKRSVHLFPGLYFDLRALCLVRAGRGRHCCARRFAVQHSRTAPASAAVLAARVDDAGPRPWKRATPPQRAPLRARGRRPEGIQRFLYTIVSPTGARSAGLTRPANSDRRDRSWHPARTGDAAASICTLAAARSGCCSRRRSRAGARNPERSTSACISATPPGSALRWGWRDSAGATSSSITPNASPRVQDLNGRRRRRFAGLIRTHYDAIFAPRGDPGPEQPCEVRQGSRVCDILEDEQRRDARNAASSRTSAGGRPRRATAIIRAEGPDLEASPGSILRAAGRSHKVRSFRLRGGLPALWRKLAKRDCGGWRRGLPDAS